MSLIQSARMNGHDPYAYLKDVLMRLPTQRASEIGQHCRINGHPPELRKVSSADAYCPLSFSHAVAISACWLPHSGQLPGLPRRRSP